MGRFPKSPVETYLSDHLEKFWRDLTKLRNHASKLWLLFEGIHSDHYFNSISSTLNCPVLYQNKEILIRSFKLFISCSNLFLPFHCGCRGFILHLITLSDIYIGGSVFLDEG